MMGENYRSFHLSHVTFEAEKYLQRSPKPAVTRRSSLEKEIRHGAWKPAAEIARKDDPIILFCQGEGFVTERDLNLGLAWSRGRQKADKRQSVTKLVETLCPKGAFWCSTELKGVSKEIPLPSPPCNVVPLFELPVESNKHPNFEWREGGRGEDDWSYPIFVYNVSTIFVLQVKSWLRIAQKLNFMRI